MSCPGNQSGPSSTVAAGGTRDGRESVWQSAASGQVGSLTDDDLLLMAICWIKVMRGDGPSFVADVASIFWRLKKEFREATQANAARRPRPSGLSGYLEAIP